MHDVLDPRDLVPDEAEQLRLSGHPVGSLEDEARSAAAAGDTRRLGEIGERLDALQRDPAWSYVEPNDETSLIDGLKHLAPLTPRDAELADRIRGAWLGRAVGNTMGKPIEGLTRTQVEIYLRAAGQWPQTGYVPLLDPLPDGVPGLHPSAPVACAGRFHDVPRDDDIDWTILGLHLLETYGHELTTERIAAQWLDRVPFTQTYTAERAAYRNLVYGLRAPQTAMHQNPYREWIGALIRGDVLGYASPGERAEAARLAYVDARLTHVANGIYGEMWVAALTSSALCVDNAAEALDAALEVVPPRSRLGAALRTVGSLRQGGAPHTDALDHVDAALGHYPWVHTINNAALIAVGLLWGESFTDAVGITISGGRDTDSNGATVGSVYGAVHGHNAIPFELIGSTHVHVQSAIRGFDRIRIDDLAQRTHQIAMRGLAG